MISKEISEAAHRFSEAIDRSRDVNERVLEFIVDTHEVPDLVRIESDEDRDE